MDKTKTTVLKDIKQKSILVSRVFDATVEKVWQCYTNAELLDQWWGPAPWRAETKTMNFSAGGYWLYAMVGPDGQKHWSRMDIISIDLHKNFHVQDSFCDESGAINNNFPVSTGVIQFSQTPQGTLVEFIMNFREEADVLKMIEMGFEQGISICLDQLTDLLKK